MTKVPLIFGHRGAMGYAPENTMASFILAWKLGVDALECDLHLSKDHKLVIMHDESLDRTTTGTGLIRSQSWDRIRRLDAGSWFHRRFRGQRPLRLKDFLEWVRNKKTPSGKPLGLVLEVKNEEVRYVGIADQMAKILAGGGMLDRTWVISFDHGVCKRVKRLCPAVKTGLLFRENLPDLSARVKHAKADGIFPRHHLITPSLVRTAHKLGLFVGTYTVNETEPLRRVAKAGVDALTTNYPDRTRDLLRLL